VPFARVIFATYVLVWLNVVVPGHTRGRVTMPGCAASGNSVAPCCASKQQSSKPTPEQKRRCAVCYVAATYSVPVVHIFDFTPAERTAVLDIPAAAQVQSIDFPVPYWPVGPPTTAA